MPESMTRAATERDAMESALAALRGRLAGRLLLPRDGDAYEAARRLWNGMADRRPRAIAQCASAADVAEAVRFAAAQGLLVAVRGGGHSISGKSVCGEEGLMIDLSRMKRVTVDPARRTARAEPGVYLGELDAATQAHGLATTMGVNSDTGIAGLTLGGGIGRLARQHGLACDNLLAAEVVLADGRIIRASATEHADLFWGLRGGGGNFGVVTAFEYRLHPLGPTVLGGNLVWRWADARAALRLYAAFCKAAPDTVDALGVILTLPSGEPALLVSAFCGAAMPEAERALRPLREGAPRPMADEVGPMAYTALQASADAVFPRGRRYYWKSHFLRDLPDPAIGTMVDWFERVASPMSVWGLQLMGGAVARTDPQATAFANRDPLWDCIPISIWEDPAADAANIGWARACFDAMTPFATGGVYVNNLGEEGEARIRAAFGANWDRLAALKAAYDPTNLFRLNQNLPPAR